MGGPATGSYRQSANWTTSGGRGVNYRLELRRYEMGTMDEARVAIHLETAPVGSDILDSFREVHEAFIEHQITFENRMERGGVVPGPAEIRAMTADLRAAVDALQQLMVQALRDLEQPLPLPWRERLRWPPWGQG
jgi:hypothetical protein